MRQFAGVIFDMDGLLLDSERIALAAFVATCEHFSLGDRMDVFLRCIGANRVRGQQVLREGFGEAVDPMEFGRVWDMQYVERISSRPIPLKDGVTALLEHLAQLEIPAAVATSTSSDRATRKLEEAGIHHRFAAVIGGDRVANSKPHPEIYLRAAEALGQRPERCLALEDSDSGVRAAVGAGMTVVQIPDLVQPSPELRTLGHIVLGSLHDVITHDFSAP